MGINVLQVLTVFSPRSYMNIVANRLAPQTRRHNELWIICRWLFANVEISVLPLQTVFTVPDRTRMPSLLPSRPDVIPLMPTIASSSLGDPSGVTVQLSPLPVLVQQTALTSSIAESTSTCDVHYLSPDGSAVADGGILPSRELLDVRY